MIVTADRVVTADAVLAPGWVQVDDDTGWSTVGEGAPPRPGRTRTWAR